MAPVAFGDAEAFADRVLSSVFCGRVATGLAVTGVGGDVLFIEATSMDGP